MEASGTPDMPVMWILTGNGERRPVFLATFNAQYMHGLSSVYCMVMLYATQNLEKADQCTGW